MVKVTGVYQGQKHCELTHGPSGAKISTDAPKDNAGKGELFSPTDLVGAALGSCMLTVMAIVAERDGVSLEGAHFEINKEMSASPRRIAKLEVILNIPAGVPPDYRAKLESTAKHCPVHHSLHPEIEIPVTFKYGV